jgi:hypothetical protein
MGSLKQCSKEHGRAMRAQAGWGSIEIDGRRYEGDVIIHVDGKVTPRQAHLSSPYRAELFHTPLSEDELGFVAEESPEVVYVAAGHKGMLTLTPKAKELLSPYELRVMLTNAAVEALTREGRRFVAILHLTC